MSCTLPHPLYALSRVGRFHFTPHCDALRSVWDSEDANSAAEEDWARDSKDGEILSEELFKDAIFELADVWCAPPRVRVLLVCAGAVQTDPVEARTIARYAREDLSAGVYGIRTYAPHVDVYCDFLTDLFHHIAVGKPPNAYFWCAQVTLPQRAGQALHNHATRSHPPERPHMASPCPVLAAHA